MSSRRVQLALLMSVKGLLLQSYGRLHSALSPYCVDSSSCADRATKTMRKSGEPMPSSTGRLTRKEASGTRLQGQFAGRDMVNAFLEST